MDGTLSQEEINALLNGSVPAAAAAETIDALSDMEKDIVGEVANISMGTSATTLSTLLNQKVDITIPTVSITKWEDLVAAHERPCVFVQIEYTVGLDGTNLMILKEDDVKIITDLMMGGDGTSIDGLELGELHLSAISEAMNQMMGSASTSLSSMLGKKIDISPPQADLIGLSSIQETKASEFMREPFVQITFRMQIGTLIDSAIMQMYPISFAKELIKYFMGAQGIEADDPTVMEQTPAPEPEPTPAPQQAPPQMAPMPDLNQQMMQQQMMQQQMMQQQMMQQQMMMPNIMGTMQPVVSQAQFSNFEPGKIAPATENIGLILDVSLEVTVELGRTRKLISDILDFSPGTIIELDKIAGEPVDVLVNGKFVAKGEVVVIDENFGIRVTEIM